MIAEGPFTYRVFCALKFIISNIDVQRKHAYNRSGLIYACYRSARTSCEGLLLSLANGLLLVQTFSQADKLRTVSRGCQVFEKKKKKKKVI